MVVGPTRFIPADEQGGVPDVGPGRGLHPPVGVVDPCKKASPPEDRRRRSIPGMATPCPMARPAAGW